MSILGNFNDSPRPYSFNGASGWWSVPAGRSWHIATDSGLQKWVSPNPITVNADGSVSGSPLFAAEMTYDGTLVFQDQLANRKTGIDSPSNDRLSPNN